MSSNEVESEVKLQNMINIDVYRQHVQTYINLHIYQAAYYWAEKVVALTCNNPRDIYWLAQCMFLLKQYDRAAHLLRSRSLDTTYVLCNYLTVKSLLEAKDLNEAFKVLNSFNPDVFTHVSSIDMSNLGTEFTSFDDTPKHQICASVFLIKGNVLEAMDNRGLAADCYRQALQCDVYCFEAFENLIQHQMLTSAEEIDLLNSLPISQQCTPEEAEVLTMLYKSKLKIYQGVVNISENKNPIPPMITSQSMFSSTPRHDLIGAERDLSTQKDVLSDNKEIDNKDIEGIPTQLEVNSAILRLEQSLDVLVSEAEYLYYICDYQRCKKLTENILAVDPYHSGCLPIHISCLVELKESNKLFTLSHKLVEIYPDRAVGWYAVGCYYYVTGRSDCSRRNLLKATTLDKLFGPAWLAYGHSFTLDNEHDQAMVAYFKASQLMKGCHLPLLYIGLECGLTNNVPLATNFFDQAIKIAPNDPFVLQEMGVIAFQSLKYDLAEQHFKEALNVVKCSGYQKVLPECWAPLLNNLGHALRKQKKYTEAVEYHLEALVLRPQTPTTYSAIAFNHSLLGNLMEAVDWFHRALGLKGDDTFSTTMLNYLLEHLAEDDSPFPGAPNEIPNFKSLIEESVQSNSDESVAVEGTVDGIRNDLSDMSMSY
nr:cell division cycle protein 16 homolog [Onthophagus taurus]